MKQSLVEGLELIHILNALIEINPPTVGEETLKDIRQGVAVWLAQDVEAYVDTLEVKREQAQERVEAAARQARVDARQAEEDAVTDEEKGEADAQQRKDRISEGVS